MYTLSVGDDQLINWPVLVAAVWKIPTDDNRNLPCSEEWKTKRLVRDKEGWQPLSSTHPNKQLRWQLWCVKDAFLNLLTARVLNGVFEGVSNFWVCGRYPMMWPINESSLPILTHGAVCFSKFYKMKFVNVVEICLWLHLAVKRFC